MFYEFTLRKVKGRDFDRIKCLSKVIIEKEPRTDKDAFKKLIASKNFLGLVATYKAKKSPEEIVGYGSICFYSSFIAGKTALLEDLIIWRQHGQKGITGLILAHLIERADKKMADRVILANIPNQEEATELYKNLGFIEKNGDFFEKKLT